MAEIRIMERPEDISLDDIHDLLYAAHQENREKGFTVRTALMSGEELKEHLGETGKCFVALDGDKLVGTYSYRILSRNNRFVKGNVVDGILAGVLPEYRGQHISSLLYNTICEDAKSKGYKVIESRTAEDNVIIQARNKKQGYRYVDFLSTKADHYTVVMLRWFEGCPWPRWKTDLHFYLKRFFVKLRYKPGQVKRFGI